MASIETCAKSIEKIFFAYMSGSMNETEFCSRLGSTLTVASAYTSTRTKKTFEVVLIDGKSEFCGMSCYPNLEELNSLIVNMNSGNEFKKKWVYELTKYTVEIDKNMFDHSIINFNPPEMTAMILHEMAHTAFNDQLAERIWIAYKQNMSILKMQEKKTVKAAQQVFYSIPIFMACGAHTWHTGKNGFYEEYECDKIFGLEEYRPHMESALSKIIRAYGTTIFSTEHQADSIVDKNFKWCNLNITDITHRRDLIRRDLLAMSSKSRSKSFKRACLDIMVKFGIGMKDKYSGELVATESVLDMIDNGEESLNGILQKYQFATLPSASGALESMLINMASRPSPAIESAKRGRAPKLPSQYDIDTISVELDRIQNHHDRIYVLDLIHDRLDQIQEFEEFVEYTGEIKRYASKINTLRDSLNQLRVAVLRKNNFDKHYGIFVKYPAGYEG